MQDDLNDFDCDGYRPIHHAILAHDLERATKLIHAGAMLNAPTESGDGALVLLCKALRDDEVLEWLPSMLGWGAEIIDRDKKGWTALHHAVSRGMLKSVAALMEAGSDPFLKANDGVRPIDVAAKLDEVLRDEVRTLLKLPS